MFVCMVFGIRGGSSRFTVDGSWVQVQGSGLRLGAYDLQLSLLLDLWFAKSHFVSSSPL